MDTCKWWRCLAVVMMVFSTASSTVWDPRPIMRPNFTNHNVLFLNLYLWPTKACPSFKTKASTFLTSKNFPKRQIFPAQRQPGPQPNGYMFITKCPSCAFFRYFCLGAKCESCYSISDEVRLVHIYTKISCFFLRFGFLLWSIIIK